MSFLNCSTSILKTSKKFEAMIFFHLTNNSKLSEHESNTWYLSTSGNDTNDCQSETRPCRHIQTVLERASHNADIQIVSNVLNIKRSPPKSYGPCNIKTNRMFTLRASKNLTAKLICEESKFFVCLYLKHTQPSHPQMLVWISNM